LPGSFGAGEAGADNAYGLQSLLWPRGNEPVAKALLLIT
jgi:hypothetical protein